jgi:vancomycin permeability regulator SanA
MWRVTSLVFEGARLARKKNRISLLASRFGAAGALALARGTALFVGLYSLANTLAIALRPGTSQDLWWIDLRFLPRAAAVAVSIACAIALLGYGVAPRAAAWRRWLTVTACVVLAGLALQNVAVFYRQWGAGTFTPGLVFPLSLLIALVFALLGWAVWSMRPAKPTVAGHIAAIVALLVVIALFPLAQVGFFGTSDYRAEADAAVVFGARVFDSGALSPSLRDRVATGVELYRGGLVRKLIMSGGVEPNGIDETAAMRSAAIEAGVPASAILVDPKGVDTDSTVRNTTAVFRRRGIKRVLAVSQGYHLPRIKLAYLAVGYDVRTVPAREIEPIWKTPLFVAREVPAFWQYWSRALARDVVGG